MKGPICLPTTSLCLSTNHLGYPRLARCCRRLAIFLCIETPRLIKHTHRTGTEGDVFSSYNNTSRAIALRLEHTYLHVQVVGMIAAKHSDGGSVLTAAVSSGNVETFTAVMELLGRSVTGDQVTRPK